jgi:hypothetical protein
VIHGKFNISEINQINEVSRTLARIARIEEATWFTTHRLQHQACGPEMTHKVVVAQKMSNHMQVSLSVLIFDWVCLIGPPPAMCVID